MALKNNQEELPFPIETEEETQEQISFDDLEFEAEFVDEEEIKPQKFYTISGKESQYEPTWDKYSMRDMDVGIEIEGRVEITHFENTDKKENGFFICARPRKNRFQNFRKTEKDRFRDFGHPCAES